MRKVIITRSSYLIPQEELSSHPGFHESWQLPQGYTLVSINDPVFQDPKTRHAPSRSKAAAIMAENTIFAPFYQQPRSLADILALKVPTRTVFYHLITASRTLLQWPRLDLVQDWEIAEHLQVLCHYSRRGLPALHQPDSVFQEWQLCMRRLKVLQDFDRITFEPEAYSVRCHFSQSAGDAAMALFMILSNANDQTSLRSVRFTPSTSGAHRNSAFDGNPIPDVDRVRTLELKGACENTGCENPETI